MASYLWPLSSQSAQRTSSAAPGSGGLPAAAAARPTTSTLQRDDVDDFDLIDDEIRLQLSSNRSNLRCEVRAKLSWGVYLRSIFQEPQPITISYGTPEAHKILETYFTETEEKWKVAKKQMEETPALLIEVLEYTAGLQSNTVFREACDIFGRMFRSLTISSCSPQQQQLSPEDETTAGRTRSASSRKPFAGPLPWPLDTPQKVLMCGEAIRGKFLLTCDESMKSEKKVKELVRYFTGANTADMTHSSFGPKEPMANDADFNKTLNDCDPFRQREWQHDDKAAVCPSCNRQFVAGYASYLTGVYASHCRVCGLRKCRDCTPFKVDKSIARLSKPGGGEEPQMRKACVDCYRQARDMQRFAFLGQAFVYAKLDIVQISLLRTVNRVWSITAELILHGLRAAVYEFTTALSVEGVLEASQHHISPQHHRHLVDREQSQFTTISKNASPEAHRSSMLHWPSSSVAVPSTTVSPSVMRPRGGAGGVSVSSRGKTLTSAVNASIRQLYQSSARLFVDHPEHIIMLFSLLDWSNAEDVQIAIDVLQQTTEGIRAAAPPGRQHHHHHQACSDTTAHAPPLDGDKLGVWSHWHLLCSRSCNGMPKAMFGVRMLDALQRAPVCAAQEHATKMTVSSLLVKPRHDEALAAVLVPLLLDFYQNKGTMQEAAQNVLSHLASKNPALGLQMICDYRSRESLSTNPSSVDEAKRFSDLIEHAIEKSSLNRFKLGMRFVKALQDCLISFQKNRIEDPTKMKLGLLHAFQSAGLVKEVGPTATTTTTTPTTECPPPALSSSASAAAAPTDAAVALLSSATPDFITTFPFMFPFDKNVTIVGIQLQGVRLMSSKIRPVMIPLVDATNQVHRVLWKGEDMRQDYVVCLCGSRMQNILKEKGFIMEWEKGMIPHYRVLPLSHESGLVQCVEHSTSIQAIVTNHQLQQKDAAVPLPPPAAATRRTSPQETSEVAGATPPPLHSTIVASPILSYLHTVSMKVHKESLKEVRKHFLTSAKFFFLFNYVLNLRDRHRDNVMMTTRGCIFHIDFGMTRNQKTMAEELTQSYVRFDDDLAASIAHFMPPDREGRLRSQSDAIHAFLNEVADWYIAIRPHAHDLYLLLRHVVAAKHHIPAQQSIRQQSSMAFLNASITSVTAASAVAQPHHLAESVTDVFLEEDVDLQLNLEDLFQRHLGEDSARREFVRRVQTSRGKERVKDWTYETKKFATSWVSEVGARVVNMVYKQ